MRGIGAVAFTFLIGLASATHAQVVGGVSGGITGGGVQQPGQPVPGQPSTATPQRMPARPLRPGEAPPKGSAVIRGSVTAADTGSPIRRAQVTARSMEGRGGGVTSTDAQGRFEIKDLPAGRFTVFVAKGGYVQTSFGQRRPTDPGTPIDLSDGQAAEKVNFILSRGSVITGRVVDDGGEPVSGAQVAAMRYAYVSGTRRLVPAGAEGSSRSTDDQGHYRLYGLPPGEYYVSANIRNGMMAMPGMNNTETESYAPTYFPGTANVSEATRVSVRVGQEATASFAMIVARMARVSGRALNSSGQPVTNAMLMMTPADPGGMVMMMSMNNAMIGADGTFQFSNIAPGRYNVQLRPNGMATASSEVAVVPVTVGNEDIENLVVVSSPTATARGVVLTDDGTVPTFRADQVSVFAGPAEPTTMFMSPGQSRMNDDYTFEITGLFDRRLIRGSAGPQQMSGWYLKAVWFEGTDITDTGMEFTPGRTYDGLQVVFTRQATDLSGTLTDERGRPVVDATVIMFPADQQKWTYSSRYIRTMRPDTNGKYNVKSMPPLDDYLIIAVQNLESGQGSDPEFLTRARDEAKAFSLAEGETKNVDLKLSKLVP